MTLWTAAEDEKLKQLYAEQYSCSQIAGFFQGKTRNAVIGRVHRLNLPRRGAGRTPAKAKRAGRNSAPRPPRPPRPRVILSPMEEIKLRCAAVEPINYTLEELPRGSCKWPFGSGPYLFCGHPIAHGSSYCEAHFLLSIGPGTSSEQAALKISRRRLEGAW